MTQRPEHLHYDASRRFPAGLPASGAWRQGDPVGNRAFAEICGERPFVLEGGGVLPEVTIAYETWGSLDDERATPCSSPMRSPVTRMLRARWVPVIPPTAGGRT